MKRRMTVIDGGELIDSRDVVYVRLSICIILSVGLIRAPRRYKTLSIRKYITLLILSYESLCLRVTDG